MVEPIRDRDVLERFRSELMHQSYRDWFLFTFGINTGLRVSDIVPLKVGDVRGKTHLMVKEKKTQKQKRFLINAELERIIAEYTKDMSDEDYLFRSQKGGYITTVQAYRLLNKSADKLRLNEIGTHTMRKTFGYHFYQKTKDVAMLQKLFNHSAPSVTLRYIGIEQDQIDDAVRDFHL